MDIYLTRECIDTHSILLIHYLDLLPGFQNMSFRIKYDGNVVSRIREEKVPSRDEKEEGNLISRPISLQNSMSFFPSYLPWTKCNFLLNKISDLCPCPSKGSSSSRIPLSSLLRRGELWNSWTTYYFVFIPFLVQIQSIISRFHNIINSRMEMEHNISLSFLQNKLRFYSLLWQCMVGSICS